MIEANFIIDPDELKKVIIPNPTKFIDIAKIDFLGLKMAASGFKFIVTRKLAEKLIKDKIAISLSCNS